MRRIECVGAIVGKVKTVYIDGSAYSAGGTKFAGWGAAAPPPCRLHQYMPSSILSALGSLGAKQVQN